jgi:small GTP-binding protein
LAINLSIPLSPAHHKIKSYGGLTAGCSSETEGWMRSLKLVVIGDGAVGKTCLLVVYAKGSFPTTYVPTVFENYNCKVTVNNELYKLQLWDTAGQEELETIRTLSYADTDVFLFCYSIVDRASYDNIKNKWVAEIKQHVKNPTVLLVGTKADLRESEPESALSLEDGVAMAQQIGAIDYIECSAIKCQGVKDVFDRAIVAAVKPAEKASGGCCCLQ